MITPPFLTSRIIVISDFNCPYCFTLNEWLFDLGVSDRVRWVGIEHRPELPAKGENEQADRRILVDEVSDVQQRAPEVEVVKPDVWVNSHYALLYQNALEDDDPARAPLLRRAIFRSYWHDGELISDERVIQRLFMKHNITQPELEPEYLQDLSSWWKNNLDRIPCMLAPTGVAHLGLQDKRSVSAYLNSALRETTKGPGCF